MRILYFSHYYTPEGNAPATRVSALCERWAKAGHDVTVVTCPPNVPSGVVYDGYANRRTHEVINGVKVERVKIYLAANRGAVRRMLNYVSYSVQALRATLRLPKPDVVIATSPQIFCGYAGVWYKRLRHVPLVVEIRDIWPESMGAVGAHVPKPAYWFLEKVERALYRTCDALVTVGDGYRARLAEEGVPCRKISVVMNGTDLSVYKPQDKDRTLLKQWGLEGKFVVSYIGTVGMACGLEVVLDAAEILAATPQGRTVAFVVVGDGARRQELEDEAKRRGLGNVVFTGRQPKGRMPDWICSSDASLVHLRKTELFTTVMPSKVFESAGCKRPIIMGVDGFAKRLVLDAEAGLDMTPGDAASLVSCVQRLVADPDLCRTMGENAYEKIAKVHNRDRQASDYLKILEVITKPLRTGRSPSFPKTNLDGLREGRVPSCPHSANAALERTVK